MVKLYEKPESRGGMDAFEGSHVDQLYVAQVEPTDLPLWGISSMADLGIEKALRAYLWINADETYDALAPNVYYLQSIALTPTKDVSIYEVRVLYTQKKPLQYSFSTTGGTQTINYSLQTAAAYGPVGTDVPVGSGNFPNIPNFNQGINVTDNGIEGVDIVVRQLNMKITKSFAGEADGFDDDFLTALQMLPGSTNDSKLSITLGPSTLTFWPDELRFDGADIQQTTNGFSEVTLSFAVSRGIYKGDEPDPYSGHPATPDLYKTVGTVLVDSKPGWHYLWVSWQETKGGVFRVRIPRAVYIEQVYYQLDFDPLGIWDT